MNDYTYSEKKSIENRQDRSIFEYFSSKFAQSIRERFQIIFGVRIWFHLYILLDANKNVVGFHLASIIILLPTSQMVINTLNNIVFFRININTQQLKHL